MNEIDSKDYEDCLCRGKSEEALCPRCQKEYDKHLLSQEPDLDDGLFWETLIEEKGTKL